MSGGCEGEIKVDLKKCVAVKYRVPINYRRNLQSHILTNTEQKYMILLQFERGMFTVS